MSTVPRPVGAPSEADDLRALLAAIGDVLDVPLGEDPAATYRLTRERAVVVRAVARACAEAPVPTDPAAWLRHVIAEHTPLPEAAQGGAQ